MSHLFTQVVTVSIPVANSINVLQAFIYKSVKTGLFLKSFEATSVA